MWRNVTPSVAIIAALDNYLPSAWMIGFGLWLVATSRASVNPRQSSEDPAGPARIPT
jgi:hypothetical protein